MTLKQKANTWLVSKKKMEHCLNHNNNNEVMETILSEKQQHQPSTPAAQFFDATNKEFYFRFYVLSQLGEI